MALDAESILSHDPEAQYLGRISFQASFGWSSNPTRSLTIESSDLLAAGHEMLPALEYP